MRIGDTKPSRVVATPSRRVERRSATPKPASVADTATMLDIPESELTPKVRAAIMTLIAEVQRLREELRVFQRRVDYLERLADQDFLLPVINRRAFVRELSRTMSFADRYGVESSVLYFDINHMKEINDRYGHAAGDAALTHVVKTMAAQLRESDIIGRLGGDEFGVILVQCDNMAAMDKAMSLSAAVVAAPFDWKGEVIPLTVSYGVYTFERSDDAEHILDAADRAMYLQKQALDRGTG